MISLILIVLRLFKIGNFPSQTLYKGILKKIFQKYVKIRADLSSMTIMGKYVLVVAK